MYMLVQQQVSLIKYLLDCAMIFVWFMLLKFPFFGKQCMEHDSLRPASCPSRELGLVWVTFEHRTLAMLLGYAASSICHQHLFRFRNSCFHVNYFPSSALYSR